MRTNLRDFASFNENLSDASNLVSTAHTPSIVRVIYESLGNLLLTPVLFDLNSTLVTPLDSDTIINTNNDLFDKNINRKMEQRASMKLNKTLATLPPDCIDKIYLEEDLSKGMVTHHVLKKKVEFYYRTLLGKCMYVYIFCRPDIDYAITTLSKLSSVPSSYDYWL